MLSEPAISIHEFTHNCAAGAVPESVTCQRCHRAGVNTGAKQHPPEQKTGKTGGLRKHQAARHHAPQKGQKHLARSVAI